GSPCSRQWKYAASPSARPPVLVPRTSPTRDGPCCATARSSDGSKSVIPSHAIRNWRLANGSSVDGKSGSSPGTTPHGTSKGTSNGHGRRPRRPWRRPSRTSSVVRPSPLHAAYAVTPNSTGVSRIAGNQERHQRAGRDVGMADGTRLARRPLGRFLVRRGDLPVVVSFVHTPRRADFVSDHCAC